MKVAQALLKSWHESKLKDTDAIKTPPLEYWLRYNYQERYLPLLARLGISELPTFSQFLRKDVSELICL